ncbi:nuclear speckle splicing regulatory protein 1-like isoform X2 [Hyposmocoma kahamanoa]|nr:nuclear speckle splicing regulatory protein 1-like isoform X2 [Hyposmocoma kahamanoa]
MLMKLQILLQFIFLIFIENVSTRFDREPDPETVARMLNDKNEPIVVFVNSNNNVDDNQLALSERANDRNERERNELERDRNDLDRDKRDRYELDRNERDEKERYELDRNDQNNLLRYGEDRNVRLRSERDRNERDRNDLYRNERNRNEREDFTSDRYERDRNEQDRNDWNRNERNWNERDRNEDDRNDWDKSERELNWYEQSRNRAARNRMSRNRNREIQRLDLAENESDRNEDRYQGIDRMRSLSDSERAENQAYLFYNLLRSQNLDELDPEAAQRLENTKDLLTQVLRQRCYAEDICKKKCKPKTSKCKSK